MSKEKAKSILGNRAIWELRAIKKALEKLPLLNTAEENQRLEAVNILLKK